MDAPSPRRISRLSTEELLQSFALAGPIDGSKLPAALRPAPIPEAPSAGLAVTRDFHRDADRVATMLAGAYVSETQVPPASCSDALSVSAVEQVDRTSQVIARGLACGQARIVLA